MDVEAATYFLGWVRSIQLIAVFFVAVGVVAEFGGEWISRPLEKIIDEARELHVKQLTNETARLTADAEASRAAIAGANKRAEEAKADAAKAQLALETMRAPRSISPEKRSVLIDSIKGFAGQEYGISVASGSGVSQFACVIDAILLEAGWKKLPPWGAMQINTDCGSADMNSLTGLHLRVALQADPQIHPAVEALAMALASTGNVPDIARDPTNIPNMKAVWVMVGDKPL